MSDVLEGKIAAILDDNTVVINKGSSDGVNENDKFYVYVKLGPFEDPDSGEDLGHTEKIISRVAVDVVESKFCIASTPTKTSLGLSFPDPLSGLKRYRPSLPIDESESKHPSGSMKVKVGSPVFRPASSSEDEADLSTESSDESSNGKDRK